MWKTDGLFGGKEWKFIYHSWLSISNWRVAEQQRWPSEWSPMAKPGLWKEQTGPGRRRWSYLSGQSWESSIFSFPLTFCTNISSLLSLVRDEWPPLAEDCKDLTLARCIAWWCSSSLRSRPSSPHCLQASNQGWVSAQRELK